MIISTTTFLSMVRKYRGNNKTHCTNKTVTIDNDIMSNDENPKIHSDILICQ